MEKAALDYLQAAFSNKLEVSAVNDYEGKLSQLYQQIGQAYLD